MLSASFSNLAGGGLSVLCQIYNWQRQWNVCHSYTKLVDSISWLNDTLSFQSVVLGWHVVCLSKSHHVRVARLHVSFELCTVLYCIACMHLPHPRYQASVYEVQIGTIIMMHNGAYSGHHHSECRMYRQCVGMQTCVTEMCMTLTYDESYSQYQSHLTNWWCL